MRNSALCVLVAGCVGLSGVAMAQPGTPAADPKPVPAVAPKVAPKADQPKPEPKPEVKPEAKPEVKYPVVKLVSSAFTENTQMPKKYTVDGENVSPPLSWTEVPKGTKEFALLMFDPDVKRAGGFTHWVIFKIPATAISLPEALPQDKELTKPIVAAQGESSFRKVGYLGPAAGKGGGVHHYHFKLFALDAALDVKPGANREALEKAMEGHIIGVGELVGTNER